jgi:hypothetical protein
VKGDAGTPLFRVRYRTDTIALILPIEKVSAAVLEQIQSTVARILQGVSIPSHQERRLPVTIAHDK